jgi:hypothetical protein
MPARAASTPVGETQVRLRLAGAHGAPQVSEILSEGEQRALSLAFFLAEVAMFEEGGGSSSTIRSRLSTTRGARISPNASSPRPGTAR